MHRAMWLAGLVTSVLASPARADDLAPSRVTVRSDGTGARLGLTFRVRVAERGHTALIFDRPSRAVVVAGSVTDASGRHRMTLVPADKAQTTLDALAEAPASRSRASMVVVGDSGTPMLSLDVLSPRPGALTIELELAAPTCFDRDKRYVAIPMAWADALTTGAKRRVEDDRAEELKARCAPGVEEHTSAWIGLPAPALARRPAGASRIGATAARFSAGEEQAARLELAIATTLGDIPADLHTAFVIDLSRSVPSDQLDAARALVRSYLAHAPRTSVQVIGYARTATALLERWTPAAKAAKPVDTLLSTMQQRNGSELQAGLREAAAWLERVPGTRRIVILSDERVADRVAKLSTATLAKELPAGTLVHVVALSYAGLTRDDGARWAGLAAATEGIAMRGGLDDFGLADALPLVRPISLDHVRIAAPGWELLEGPEAACVGPEGDEPRSLGEGQSCTWWATSSAGDSLDVEGMLWGRRWKQTVPLGDRADIAVARQVQFVLDEIAPLAIAALDAAKAVSSRWSLVARWGGQGGYGDVAGGGTGWGTFCGCGSMGTIGHGSGTGSGVAVQPSLRTQLFDVVGRCTRDDITIELTVETTLNEIVDVDATANLRNDRGAPTDREGIETCVEEAVWNTHVHFANPREHETTRLRF